MSWGRARNAGPRGCYRTCDGRYIAMYSGHATDTISRWRISERAGDASDWGPEQTLDTGANFLGERPHWRNWPETFDFVVWIDFAKAPKPELRQLRSRANATFLEIYRVVRQ